MEYTTLGKTDIKISKLCVGCMSFGKPSADFHEWTLDPQETEKMVSHALELGINFFDTANTYAHGTSEEYLGRAIKNFVFHLVRKILLFNPATVVVRIFVARNFFGFVVRILQIFRHFLDADFLHRGLRGVKCDYDGI